MVEPLTFECDHGDTEEQLLILETGNADRSWRLNFDGFELSSEHKEKPPRGLQDCLGVLGKFIIVIIILGFFFELFMSL